MKQEASSFYKWRQFTNTDIIFINVSGRHEIRRKYKAPDAPGTGWCLDVLLCFPGDNTTAMYTLLHVEGDEVNHKHMLKALDLTMHELLKGERTVLNFAEYFWEIVYKLEEENVK